MSAENQLWLKPTSKPAGLPMRYDRRFRAGLWALQGRIIRPTWIWHRMSTLIKMINHTGYYHYRRARHAQSI